MGLSAASTAHANFWLSSVTLVTIFSSSVYGNNFECDSADAERFARWKYDPDASNGLMPDLRMNKTHFFNWGRKRINLTKYLIQHAKNNSHWSNIISIDDEEDKEVFERYHEKQGEVFLDEMIKELDEKVAKDFPIKFRIVHDMYGNMSGQHRLYESFDKMMRVRNLIVKDFENFAERRILKLPMMQKRYFRSLFFYNTNIENPSEFQHYVRSYFKLEDDIDSDMLVQQANLRKILTTILDTLHNQYYLDFQKAVESQFLKSNMTSFNYTRPRAKDYTTKYYNIP